jgi:ADP-heptose:LPS heptosyltransferase
VLIVLRASGLGDLLVVVPALRALADAHPGHRRVLATTEVVAPLARTIDAVDEIVTVEPLGPLPPALRGADVAVNLHGKGPQSHRVLLALQPKQLLAFRHPAIPSTASFPAWKPETHEVARWCEMLHGFGVPAETSRLSLPRPRGEPPRYPGATIVHPGAGSPARRWPVTRWAEVAAAEHEAGRTVLVTGDPAERQLASRVARLAGVPEEHVVAGTTSIIDLATIVADAGRVLCGDTGMAHLATCYSTPSVVLFGPTSPSRWGPPPSPIHRVVWKGREGSPDGPRPFPGLLDISVDDVQAEIRALDAMEVAAAPERGQVRSADGSSSQASSSPNSRT